jgi:hypothetical protein
MDQKLSQKLWPEPVALAFQNLRPGQSCGAGPPLPHDDNQTISILVLAHAPTLSLGGVGHCCAWHVRVPMV